jgi:hypothetical protein
VPNADVVTVAWVGVDDFGVDRRDPIAEAITLIAAATPTRAKQPPNTALNTFSPPWVPESSRFDSAPAPTAPNVAAKTRPRLWAMSPPTTLPTMPPNTNANHQPVPAGHVGTGP